MNGPGRRIGFLLTSVPAVEAISVQLNRIDALHQSLARALPGELGRLCRVAQVSEGVVVLEAQSSAVSAKLKALAPRLLSAFRSAIPELRGLQIKVRVTRRSMLSRRPPRRIGPTGIRSLAALARGLPSGPLESAVRRMLQQHGESHCQDESLEREERQHDQDHDHGVLECLPTETQPAPVARDHVHQHRPADREQDQKSDDA